MAGSPSRGSERPKSNYLGRLSPQSSAPQLLGEDAAMTGRRIGELSALLGFDGGKTIADDYLREVGAPRIPLPGQAAGRCCPPSSRALCPANRRLAAVPGPSIGVRARRAPLEPDRSGGDCELRR
jgi:hypothetical protein